MIVQRESHLDLAKTAELLRAIIGVDTPTVEGEIGRNDTDKRIEVFINGNLEKLAFLSDINDVIGNLGSLKGSFDASAGTVPTVGAGESIVAGDYWRVSTAGTIAGLSPQEKVELGDVIFASVNDATGATDFFVVQGNNEVFTELETALAQVQTIDEKVDSLKVSTQKALAQNAKDFESHTETVAMTAGTPQAISFPKNPTWIGMPSLSKNGQMVEGGFLLSDDRKSLTLDTLTSGDFIVSAEYSFDPTAEGTVPTLTTASAPNIFIWKAGSAPTTAQVEAGLGITLTNPVWEGDILTFSNTGYTIIDTPHSALPVDPFQDIVYIKSQAITVGDAFYLGGTKSLETALFPIATRIEHNAFTTPEVLTRLEIPLATSFGDEVFMEIPYFGPKTFTMVASKETQSNPSASNWAVVDFVSAMSQEGRSLDIRFV